VFFYDLGLENIQISAFALCNDSNYQYIELLCLAKRAGIVLSTKICLFLHLSVHGGKGHGSGIIFIEDNLCNGFYWKGVWYQNG
jgi:hypothetical protein